MNNPTKKIPHYDIDGMTLRAYCELHDYIYPTVKTYAQNIAKQNPNMPKNQVAMQAIIYYEQNHVTKEKYFYKRERLIDFCNQNQYPYANMVGYLCQYVKNPADISEEEMKKAIHKWKIKERKKCFLSLQGKQTLEECEDILNCLKIDIHSILLVINFDVSWKEAIFFVWFFGYERNDEIVIDAEAIQKVYQNLNNLETLELNELIGYYKAKLYDTREIIYQKTYLSVKKIVNNLLKKYDIKAVDFKIEIETVADSVLLEVIERCTSRNLGQIITYMNAYINGEMKRYITKELNERRNMSLNTYKFKESHNKVEKIDLISKTDSADTEYFSSELLSILANLTDIERKFIFLKYQKQYELFEITQMLNLSLEELEQLDIIILNKLRKMESVKRLIKRC